MARASQALCTHRRGTSSWYQNADSPPRDVVAFHFVHGSFGVAELRARDSRKSDSSALKMKLEARLERGGEGEEEEEEAVEEM